MSHSLSFYCPGEKYSMVSTGPCQHPGGKVWREGETSPCVCAVHLEATELFLSLRSGET